MKTLIMAALAIAAVGANIAFAEEDDGIVSAAPVIADPVNPQPGMVVNAYNLGSHITSNIGRTENQNAVTPDALAKSPSVRTYVDKSTSFTRAGVAEKTKVDVIKWEGFIKCKRAATYTFSFDMRSWYTVYVNGRQCGNIDNIRYGQLSVDADLKLGWNKVVFVADIGDDRKLDVKFRPKGSLSDPRPLSPGMLFYDKPVEEEW